MKSVYVDKAQCSGCSACVQICPKQCITMTADSEGFLYPQIDEIKCIGCGLCQKACQAITPITATQEPEAYAAYNVDENIRLHSSSGGVFTLLAEWIVGQGGTVFGAGYDEDFQVRHVAVNTIEDLEQLRGSKYVQSEIGSTYQQVEMLLRLGKIVLFTGTPCQIDGLLHYLRKPYPNLYTQDLICHGAPSPAVWKEYVKIREAKAASKTRRTFSRHKKYGWKMYSVFFEFSNNTEYIQILKKDLYMQGFLANLSLRPSCYSCHSKGAARNSDITLADFWGVDKILPEMFDDKGTSLVLVHTEKGREMLQAIRSQLVIKPVELDEALKSNSAALHSVAVPEKREQFWKLYHQTGYSAAVKQCCSNSLAKRFFRKLKSFIHYV